ncbi:hypothetical protein, partial [Streptomyces sp. NPDC001919]
FIDYALNWNLATKPWLIIPIGLVFAAIYYVVHRGGGAQPPGGEGREFAAGARLVERRADRTDRLLHGPDPGQEGVLPLRFPLRHDTSTAERSPGGVPGHPHSTSGRCPARGTDLVRDGCAAGPDLIEYSRGYWPVDDSAPRGDSP